MSRREAYERLRATVRRQVEEATRVREDAECDAQLAVLIVLVLAAVPLFLLVFL